MRGGSEGARAGLRNLELRPVTREWGALGSLLTPLTFVIQGLLRVDCRHSHIFLRADEWLQPPTFSSLVGTMTLGKVFSTDNQQVGTVFLPNPLGTLHPDGTFPGDSKRRPKALKTEEGQACCSQAERFFCPRLHGNGGTFLHPFPICLVGVHTCISHHMGRLKVQLSGAHQAPKQRNTWFLHARKA